VRSYRSHADLGGQEGYGVVRREPEGELFHADWERIALALTLAMGATGTWNIDKSRSVRETLVDYSSLTYYEVWIRGLIELLVEYGLAGRDEIAEGRMLRPARPIARLLHAADVSTVLAKGSPALRPAHSAARFAVGDRVRTRAAEVAWHTRLPGYARGKTGRVELVHGVHVFADSHAQGLGEQPQWLYNVVFDSRELWGDDCDPRSTVSIDAWESYLDPLS
jgi:nitrile hydratase subunit beta